MPHWNKYLITLVIIFITTLIQYTLWNWIQPSVYLLFFPAIVIASLYGDGPSALILSALISQYMFTSPYYTLKMHWPDDYIRTAIFLASGLLIRQITHFLKLEKQKALRINQDLFWEREIRERFVATLTHDLHTPLTAAKLNIQILKKKSTGDKLVEEKSDKVLLSIDRMEHMIRDLLDATKIKAGQGLPLEKEDCNLREIVASTLEILVGIHGPRFIVRSNEEVRGHWNYSGVCRILENLCSNAVKYGSPKTPINISYSVIGEMAKLSVQNEGPIIPEEKKHSLFDPFTQMSEGEKHSG